MLDIAFILGILGTVIGSLALVGVLYILFKRR